MKSLLKSYPSEFASELNRELMNKEADAPLVDYIVDSWKSLEVVKNIKFVGYEYTEKESEIDVNKYIFKREKKKKKKEKYDYKFIQDDRFGKLTVHLQITLMEKDPETGKEFQHVYPIKKDMLIPIQDEHGYFYIHGKKYYLIYQMVEKSTYTSNSAVTLKSLMPIAIKRGIVEHEAIDNNNITDESMDESTTEAVDIHGNMYNIPFYNIFVFRKEIPVILFYIKDGFDAAMDFLGVSGAIRLISKVPSIPHEDSIYFQISGKCYIEVNRRLFNKYAYLQSIVGGILHVSSNRNTIQSFDDAKIWIKKISGTNNYEKGLDILNFFNRLLDKPCLVQYKPL